MTLNSSDFTGVVVTAATPTVDLGDELDAVAGSCKDITTLEQLKQVLVFRDRCPRHLDAPGYVKPHTAAAEHHLHHCSSTVTGP